MKPQRIACIGECMIEMRHSGGAKYEMAFGGDTANTAIYLSRLTKETDHRINYISALGDDHYSEQMCNFLQVEGVGVGKITIMPNEIPGLYFIRTDDSGERSFSYYRSTAAAKKMFEGETGEALLMSLAEYDWLYLSGISLSIIDKKSRACLLEALDEAKQCGANIIFDGNYRPSGWPNKEVAQQVFSDVLTLSAIALVTFEDEQTVFGDLKPEDTVRRLREIGVPEGVVKLGAQGCLVFSSAGESLVPVVDEVKTPVDTTAAGDSFNAGFIAAHINGSEITEAARMGNLIAGKVIQHQGAIVPPSEM